ncbi:molybdopterin molybdotransferase MoeA [Pasteurella atlantica]|uniref:molybdopterin molybdotransferase MoeA n=1 Tax=Pasteurellaceae TaxID=712 RepID=UPI00274E8336|nr:gephyrin-like molybdotransferase Glp [Pasteurella atlantica]MDP8033511.1 molybdopterin molybdotransferase MoeA [Pasteurella atlantica]MDP8035447.1 molybdopterin molybdotransferase MoeA [Pasteurella atlantica]MDP8037398.1 molybdopterin molybdotransferase MoeA [Pasteurella atlantica]MDP8047746.1 molybdopterin molybdotransferase MoeA [Pasteurella atlantica]MDP8049693.1 molybdopterin molybdotransferase MoeA [Pasteurella atlantica]
MIHVEDLRRIIIEDINSIPKKTESESVALLNAIGSVLSEDIVSDINIPTSSVSAMDGYALHSSEQNFQEKSEFVCIGESIAGKPFSGVLGSGECVRIMTGAVIPENTDCVVMQENVQREETENKITIKLMKTQPLGNNIRREGEEVSKGLAVLKAGHCISVTDIPLLASVGCGSVNVYKPLKIAVFSTGDELREAGEVLQKGQIYDSNRPTVKALLQSFPVIINDYGIIKDNPDEISRILEKAASENDIVVTSGGVSVGDYDFLKDCVSKLGNIVQYKVALKPGKPFVFGHLGKARYFGLPGNPLSTTISATLFLLPAIYQYFGVTLPKLSVKAKLGNEIKRRSGRTELQRGFVEKDANNDWVVYTQFSQDSHRIYQLSQANAFVYLPAEKAEFEKEEYVEIFPLNGKFL